MMYRKMLCMYAIYPSRLGADIELIEVCVISKPFFLYLEIQMETPKRYLIPWWISIFKYEAASNRSVVYSPSA